MESKDKERVEQAFQYGTDSFSEDDLTKVMNDSQTAESKAKNLGEHLETFKLVWSLLKDYRSGVYKNVPWKFIAALGFAVAYLVSPVDVIPDFIPFVGFVDDIAVFGLVVKSFATELNAYKDWKAQQ